LAEQVHRVARAVIGVNQSRDEYHRSCQRVRLDRVGRSQLEKLLRAYLGKERREMKQPIFSVGSGVTNPFAKSAIPRSICPRAHSNRIEREIQIPLDIVVFVVNDSGTRGIERSPELSAVADPVSRSTRILPRVGKERDHDWSEGVEKPPPGFWIFSSLDIYL